MKRMCYPRASSESDSSDCFYVKAPEVNYNLSDSNSTCSGSKFIQDVTAKSTPKKNRSVLVTSESNVRVGHGELEKCEVKKTNKPASAPGLDLKQISERCKVAYECRNNMICIEGNRACRK